MGIVAVFGLIIGFIEAVWSFFVLALKIVVQIIQLAVTLLGWSINVVDWIFGAIRALILWFGAWLGPVANAIWGALQPAAIKRAAILAFTIASVLWLAFSTVANDFFYVMINPFFLNIFTYVGHLGFSLAVGVFTFIADAIRRLFHGPTKPN